MFGDTILITYPPLVVNEFSGDPEPHDFPSLAGQTVEVQGVPLDAVRMIETPTPGRPVYTTDRIEARLDYGYPIGADCAVEVPEGPFRGHYEVEGTPAHHKNRFTGWESSCTVQLIRVKG